MSHRGVASSLSTPAHQTVQVGFIYYTTCSNEMNARLTIVSWWMIRRSGPQVTPTLYIPSTEYLLHYMSLLVQ